MNESRETERVGAQRRGGALGFWFFETILKLHGLRGAYAFLYPVCLYYLLFDRSARRGGMAYVRRRFPEHRRPRLWLHVYRLMVSQGKQLIDRYVAISKEGVFDIILHDQGQLVACLEDSDSGVILLTAHIGNWQVGMTTLPETERRVHLVMRPEDNPVVSESLKISHSTAGVGIISPNSYLGGAVEIVAALNNGHIVSIMGDRSYDFDAVGVSFLGDTAWLPYGAFHIAATVGCPLVVLVTMKSSTHRYVVDASHVLRPMYESRSRREEALQEWVQEYASILESFLIEYPYQCFLFQDIWETNNPPAA